MSLLAWKSRGAAVGRRVIPPEVRDLIRKMSLANSLWGAPRVHGELLKLGINLSQATVAKYMVRQRKPPSQTWQAFLNNHIKDLVAVDFFTVPTVSFRVLYVFVVLAHDRRHHIHFSPHCGMGRPADRSCFPLGHGAALPDPRSRRHLWPGFSPADERDGNPRSAYGTQIALAEELCFTLHLLGTL